MTWQTAQEIDRENSAGDRQGEHKVEGQSLSLTPSQLSKARDAIEILTNLTSARESHVGSGTPQSCPTPRAGSSHTGTRSSSPRRTEEGNILFSVRCNSYVAIQ